MEAIFAALSIDITFFYLLIGCTLLFVVLKILLMDKLLEVLITREENTSKLLEKAQKLQQELDKKKVELKEKQAIAYQAANSRKEIERNKAIEKSLREIKLRSESVEKMLKEKHLLDMEEAAQLARKLQQEEKPLVEQFARLGE